MDIDKPDIDALDDLQSIIEEIESSARDGLSEVAEEFRETTSLRSMGWLAAKGMTLGVFWGVMFVVAYGVAKGSILLGRKTLKFLEVGFAFGLVWVAMEYLIGATGQAFMEYSLGILAAIAGYLLLKGFSTSEALGAVALPAFIMGRIAIYTTGIGNGWSGIMGIYSLLCIFAAAGQIFVMAAIFSDGEI